MTKEEMINELVKHKQEVQNDFGWNTTLQEALDAAIEALKVEFCRDRVSKAIETIVNYCSERACGNCRLFSSEGCMFKYGYPHEWLGIEEGAKNETD